MQVKLGHLPHISSNFGVSSGRLYNSLSNFSGLDSASPFVLFVSQVLGVPLHELNLLLGALQDEVHPHLMSMSLRFHIDLHVVNQLEDTGLHGSGRGLDVVLLSHGVALVHEVLHGGIDVSGLNEVLLVTPGGIKGGSGVDGSPSGKSFALDEVVDVFIEVSPGWVSDEGDLALFVDEGAGWDCLDSEVGDGGAVFVLHVVVVKVGKLLFFDEFLLLLLVLINAECDSSDLALPLLGVSSHHLLDSGDGNVAILAPGSPEVDEHDLTLLGSDGGLSDSGVFRGILKLTEF